MKQKKNHTGILLFNTGSIISGSIIMLIDPNIIIAAWVIANCIYVAVTEIKLLIGGDK